MIKIILLLLGIAFFIPGLYVHIQSLLIMKKMGDEDLFWKSFSPIVVFATIIFVIPLYTVSAFFVLLSPAHQRKQNFVDALKKATEQTGSESVELTKKSIILAMAKLFRINLEEDK